METIGWMVDRGHSISHSLLRTSQIIKTRHENNQNPEPCKEIKRPLCTSGLELSLNEQKADHLL